MGVWRLVEVVDGLVVDPHLVDGLVVVDRLVVGWDLVVGEHLAVGGLVVEQHLAVDASLLRREIVGRELLQRDMRHRCPVVIGPVLVVLVDRRFPDRDRGAAADGHTPPQRGPRNDRIETEPELHPRAADELGRPAAAIHAPLHPLALEWVLVVVELDRLGPVEEEDHRLLVALEQRCHPLRVVVDHERLEGGGDGLELPVTDRCELVCEVEGGDRDRAVGAERLVGVADEQGQPARPGDSAAGAPDHHPVVSFHSAPSVLLAGRVAPTGTVESIEPSPRREIRAARIAC